MAHFGERCGGLWARRKRYAFAVVSSAQGMLALQALPAKFLVVCLQCFFGVCRRATCRSYDGLRILKACPRSTSVGLLDFVSLAVVAAALVDCGRRWRYPFYTRAGAIGCGLFVLHVCGCCVGWADCEFAAQRPVAPRAQRLRAPRHADAQPACNLCTGHFKFAP